MSSPDTEPAGAHHAVHAGHLAAGVPHARAVHAEELAGSGMGQLRLLPLRHAGPAHAGHRRDDVRLPAAVPHLLRPLQLGGGPRDLRLLQPLHLPLPPGLPRPQAGAGGHRGGGVPCGRGPHAVQGVQLPGRRGHQRP